LSQIELIAVRDEIYDDEKQENKPIIELEFIVPCGGRFPAEYWSEESLIESHLETCQACKILTGKSKQKTGFRQDELASLFTKGIFDKSTGTKNLISEGLEGSKNAGTLTHYSTIEAIRLDNGTVIRNSQCWSSGFASCPRFHSDMSLPLTTLDGIAGIDLFDIEVIEKSEHWNNNVVFKVGDKFMLFGHDEFRPFLAQLPRPVSSLKDAEESLKPDLVKQCKDVKRQGDLFFIPLSVTDSELKAKKISIEKQTKVKFCKLSFNYIHEMTDNEEIKDQHRDYSNKMDDISRKLNKQDSIWNEEKGKWDHKPMIPSESKEGKELHAEYDKLNKEVRQIINKLIKEQKPTIETRNIQIYDTNHRPFRKAKYFMLTKDNEIVKGKIKHMNRQHSTLDLGETWHLVVKNLAVRTWQITAGRVGGGD
jgi:hypothetical protein